MKTTQKKSRNGYKKYDRNIKKNSFEYEFKETERHLHNRNLKISPQPIQNSKLNNSKSQAKPRTIQNSKFKIAVGNNSTFNTQHSTFHIGCANVACKYRLFRHEKSSTKKSVLEKIHPPKLAFSRIRATTSHSFFTKKRTSRHQND